MIVRRTFLLSATLALVSSIRCVEATAGGLPAKVVSSARTPLEKTRQYYTHVTVVGQRSHDQPQAGKSVKQQFTFRALGQKARLDAKAQKEKGKGGPPLGSTQIYFATPDASLNAFRGAKSSDFDTATQHTYASAMAEIGTACPLYYTYALDQHGTVLDFLQRSNVTVRETQEIKQDGQRLVKIDFTERVAKRESQTEWDSWVVLSPDEGWSVREFHRVSGTGANETVIRGTLTYEGSADGVPLVKHLEIRHEQGPQHTCVLHDVIDVSKLVPLNSEQYFRAETL